MLIIKYLENKRRKSNYAQFLHPDLIINILEIYFWSFFILLQIIVFPQNVITPFLLESTLLHHEIYFPFPFSVINCDGL